MFQRDDNNFVEGIPEGVWNRYKSCQNIGNIPIKINITSSQRGGEMLKIVDINILAVEGWDWLACHKTQSNIQK